MTEPDSETHASRPRRRTVLAVGIGAVVAAALGVPAVWSLLVRPGGKLVEPLLKSDPFYVAHRGGSLDWPEMSMEAYRNSVAAGVDALEISLARTSDGVWFGLHDATLDRTSGTTGFVASEHTWAEVQQHLITAAETDAPHQAAQPYLRFSDLVDAYGATHAIFVDPKAVAPAYYPELFTLFEAQTTPTATFIAKGYCRSTAWAKLARGRGYTTWGYYYGSEIESGQTPLDATSSSWDVLGLDYGASAQMWAQIRSLGKTVLAHVVPSKAAARVGLGHGARGLVVSGVTQVLG